MQRNFGQYSIPSTLQVLIDFQKELGDSEQFYESLHFYLTLADFRYFNTPCDVIVFGHIGSDGIHYGFLTDFSTAIDLDEAPIVSVCPMNFDEPTHIIAENLRTFLALNFTDEGLFYNTFANEQQYEAYKEQYYTHPLPIQHKLIERLNLPRIHNPYRYLKSLQAKRKQLVTIETQNQLGVITPLATNELHIPFPIQQDATIDLQSLRSYLAAAPIASQQAIFRDIQHHYVLHEYPELQKIVLEAMLNSGLVDEAARLTL